MLGVSSMKPPDRKTIPVDLEAIRARLQAERGQQYWRSLEEVAATEEFAAFLAHEFPHQAAAWHDPVSRRRFLQLMGASLEPWSHRRLRPGRGPVVVRSRPLAGGEPCGPYQYLECFSDRHQCPAGDATPQERRRATGVDRDGHVTDPRLAARHPAYHV